MAKHPRRSRDALARDNGFRGQRLEGLFRDELNFVLDSEITDPRLEHVRVSRVELTRDGACARIWFVMKNSSNHATTTEIYVAFERAAGFLRSRLCDVLPLKRSPALRFRHDPAAVVQSLPFDESI